MPSTIRSGIVLLALIAGVVVLARLPISPGESAAQPGILDGRYPSTRVSLDWYEKNWKPSERIGGPVAACFAEGTPLEIIQRVQEQLNFPDEFRYNLVGRWPGSQGDPIVLTWSFVPDGVTIPSGIGEGSGPNELFARMDSLFAGQGGRATWVSRFQQSFDRWAALTGTSYVRLTAAGVDWDDGAAWGSAGNGTTRGDVRIGMKVIDGVSNTLAYNNFPSGGGDMVLDRAESWNSSGSSNIFLRDVVMHEHGHGLGIAHVCPLLGGTNGRLMEPIINTSIDGPRHDDLRAGQRFYGDNDEPNNTAATATDLGSVTAGVPVSRGAVPPPTIPNTSILSIDADGEQDYYRFTTSFAAKISTLTVTPQGFSYDSSTQAGDGSCNSGNITDSLSAQNLNVQIIGTDGTTVLATGASQPAGSAESLSEVQLTGSPGNFYIRIYEGSTSSLTQLYTLTFTVVSSTADVTPPTPNPLTWASEPAPLSSTEITMTATTATDVASPPVEYQFDFTTGSDVGGTDSPWQTSTVYIDDGLVPNNFYNYRVRARDQAVPNNLTGYSSTINSPTHIETPVSVSFGTITDTSIEVFADGTFTNIGFISTGFFFEMTPAAGRGANVWVASPTTTVTGLTPGVTYTFRARARNWSGLETPFSSPNGATTPGGSCTLEGDVNNDSVLNALDIAGFVRCKLGTQIPEDQCLCADLGNGDLQLDVDEFIAALLAIP